MTWQATHTGGASCRVSYGDLLRFMSFAKAEHMLKVESAVVQVGDWSFSRITKNEGAKT